MGRQDSTGAIGPLLILLCTVIWGSAFIAQKLGADHYGPIAINCYRNVIAGFFLWGVLAIRNRARWAVAEGDGAVAFRRRRETLGGVASGICVFAAEVAQQVGIEHTTPGVSAFLTANYVLLVPVFAWLIGRGRPGVAVWIGVALATAGSYFISLGPGERLGAIGTGEAWTLACAVLFAVQIMVVDHFVPGSDMLRFSMVQMFAAGLVALPFLLLPSELKRLSLDGFVKGLPALAYLGIVSSGIAYTLQNLGQARTPPALAAIIMAMESVFGAFFGWILLGDVMTTRQLFGCASVLAAVILSQLLPFRRNA